MSRLKLHQIEGAGAVDGQGLVWDNNLSKWVPKTVPKDDRWTLKTGQTSIDEFNNSSLDVAWVRVDKSGGAARAVWTEYCDSLSGYSEGGDSTEEIHGLMRPIGTAPVTGDAFVSVMSFMAVADFIKGGIIVADGVAAGVGTQVHSLTWMQKTGGWSIWSNARARTGYDTLLGVDGATLEISPRTVVWNRLVKLATDQWRSDLSPDGISWIKGTPITRAITPTHVGLAISSWGTATKGVVSYEYLRRVAGVT